MNSAFQYKGIWILQPPCVVESFSTFFSVCNPDLIIEIGTKHGGLTTLLCDLCPEADVHTYDIVDQAPNLGHAVFHLGDVFDAEGEIAALIAGRKYTLVICDGGNKLKEFITFAPHLKVGDMIMAHDFKPNTCEEWQWEEICELDIAETVKNTNLIPNQWNVMSAAAWGSYKREYAKLL